jgi:hypothetical protein
MLTHRRSIGGNRSGLNPIVCRRKCLAALAVFAVACLVLSDVAYARKDRGRNRDDAVQPPPAAPVAPALTLPTTLTKSLAIDGLLEALAMNRSAAAEKTLERIVTGEIAFGGHSQQAAQAAMLMLALHPSPPAETFLLRIFTDPDESIRPGDQGVYPASALRSDAAHALARIGSPNLRLELAKVYTQSSTPPTVRSAIEEIIRSPTSANFAAQVEVFRSADTPEGLKEKLQKILLEKNVSAVKLALRLEADAFSQPGAGAGGFPFSAPVGGPAATGDPTALLANAAKMLGSLGAPPATPSAGAPRNAAGATAKQAQAMAAFLKQLSAAKPTAAMPPAVIGLELLGQMQSLQPIDPGMVARELWKDEFVGSIFSKLADAKADKSALVSALASIPTKSAREKLKEVLHKERTKGPQEFGKVEAVLATAADVPATPVAPPRRFGRRKKDDESSGGNADQGEKPHGLRMGLGMQNQTPPQSKQEVVDFGKDWFDPGSLVVLKTVVAYDERPKEKPGHHAMYQQQQGRLSPAAERRAHERAEKQKALESKYEWRDAVEKAVRQWDDRLSAVAEAPSEPQAAGDSSDNADKDTSATAKTAKPGAAPSKKASKTASSKTDTAKTDTAKAETAKTESGTTPPTTAAPTPAVTMPFGLHGGTIAKEYHLRWPEDLTGSLGSAVTDPLTVHYVRLEGTAEFAKVRTHYRSAIMGSPSGKPPKLREIENGTWLDMVQTDPTKHRTRSVDVLVTRPPSDDENGKRTKLEEVTVEILFVEIETPGPDATPGSTKKEHRETTSTTPP